MKIGILAAMSKELELLLPLVENPVETLTDGLKMYTGRIGHHDVALMQCGIGKVNAALNAYRMIHAFGPELVINSGVAGGADRSMAIGTLLVADYAAYHDVWCGPGTEYGAADGMETFLPADSRVVEAARRVLPADGVRYGLICSGDAFITTAAEVDGIKYRFPGALACDMESAAIAHTCIGCGVPFAILRVVSDTPGSGENIEQYRNFWGEAPRKTFEALRAILDALD